MKESAQTRLSRRHVLRMGLAASAVSIGLGGATIAQARRAPERAVGGAKIDPATVQVMFADLQSSLVADSKTALPDAIGRSSGVLANVAAILKLPMLFSVVPEGSRPPTLIPELQPYGTPSNTILRKLAGPFMDAPTAATLARTRRKTLIVAGYAAEVVVLQAVLDATAAGYAVHYVVDAIGSKSARTEDAAFREMDRAGAFPTSVLSLTTRLAPDFFHSPGSETFAALQKILRE